MTSEVVIVVEEASQPALGAGLTGVPGFVEPLNPHRDSLKELLNDVSVGVVEITAEIRPSKCCQITHAIDEKFGVFDVVTVLEFPKEPRRGL
jgi:hypothetical protein